jgi:hypothetical protein
VVTSAFDRYLASFTPVADIVAFLVPLLASSGDFRLLLLCLQNSSLDGGAVRAVLAVSL